MVASLTWFRNYFVYIYNFVFNDFYIAQTNNVTLGWVLVVVFVFSVMIKNILALGRVGQTYSTFRSSKNNSN